jgi:alkylation response protein AidB-like acyl-CoA dehydrogenase
MQPIISQAVVATRMAEMRQQAEVARLARDMKRARRARRRLARVLPAQSTQPACQPGHAGLGAA